MNMPSDKIDHVVYSLIVLCVAFGLFIGFVGLGVGLVFLSLPQAAAKACDEMESVRMNRRTWFAATVAIVATPLSGKTAMTCGIPPKGAPLPGFRDRGVRLVGFTTGKDGRLWATFESVS